MDRFFFRDYNFIMIIEELIRTCGPMVASLCRRVLRDAELAADAEQNIWEKVIRHKDSFRGESLPSTWVYSIARHEILRLIRDGKKRSYQELVEQYHAGNFSPEPGPVTLRDQAAGYCDVCLTGILSALDPADRLIYLFRFVAELTYADIAGIMVSGEDAVRQRASRASRKLRRFLTEECAYLVPGSTCRCGLAPRMKESGLTEEFYRLRKVTGRAMVYRDAEKVFPRSGYWMKMLEN
jgi:RNA polymerase sigma-70 factor (ECF subfamily)